MTISKDRIEKFQAGGGFMSFQPIPMTPPAPMQPVQTGPAQVDDNSGRILDDETFKSLLGKGVTNDVMQYQDQLQQASREYSRMTDIERNTARGLRLRSTLKGDIGTLTGLMRSREQFDTARDTATKNGSLGELAVTPRGMLVKDMTNGRLQEVGFDDYAKDLRSGDQRKYQALTNADVITERENNPSLVGDTKTINTLNESMGMDKIKDEIYKSLATISSNSQKVTGNKYLDVQNAKVAQAAQDLLGNAQQGVYDINSMESDSNNKAQLKMAMDTMWTDLSASAKSLLRARAVQQGAEGDDIEKLARQNAIMLMAPKESDDHQKSTISTYNHDMTVDKKGLGGLEAIGANEALISDDGTHMPITLNAGNSQKFVTYGTQIPGFFNQGKPVGKTSITNIDVVTGLGDLNSVYFGDLKVSKSKLDGIIYDGGKVAKVPVPYTTDKNGGIAPDLDMFNRMNKAKQELATIPPQSQTATVKESIYEKNNIPTDGQGNYTVPEKNFLMFSATANDKTVDGNAGTSNLVTNLSDGPDRRNAEYNYKQAYVYGGKEPVSANDLNRPEYSSRMLNLFPHPDVIQGMVFIPVTNDNIGARIIDGNSPNVNKFTTTTDYYNSSNMQNVDPPNMMERPNQVVPAYTLDALANYKPQ